MPLLGKIVVIKRNGTDGTEFPLTASCLFGRKLDCDIRIQLPQVSKEHCRIELNENKELILTNLSSVNPTRINGEVLQQSERLKHGDLITVIDRSFRFEYPPAPTPKKKRLSTPGKGETVKVLQDQQVKSAPGTTEKKKSEHITETCLKDGSNLPPCLDQSVKDEQNKSACMDGTQSPFSDLYNMVKRDLATKPVWKSTSLSNTPLSRPPVDKQDHEKVSSENENPVTSKSSQKKRRSSTAKPQTESPSAQVRTATPAIRGEQKQNGRSEGTGTPGSQKKALQPTPQKFTADQVAQQITFESPSTKSPKSRRSSGARQTPEKQSTSQNPSEPGGGEEEDESAKAKQPTRTSPRASAGKRLQVQEQEVLVTPMCLDEDNEQVSSKKHKREDLPLPAPKRKRVSFGGQLSPELFDKRLPPNSPLRRGATPGRRSLGFSQRPYSLLRRASTIGLMGYKLKEDIAESAAKKASPKRAVSPAKAQKTPSPAKALKTPSPAKALKTPSPAKALKTPSPSSNPSTPKSSRRLSQESLLKTPTTHGRFSVSRISTPSPVPNQEKETEEESLPVVSGTPQEHVTPRATPRRRSMKASARKTPKSVLKSALDVVRSRRSGASIANLKVVSSWADIVKFGQAKPQTEGGAKKAITKRTAAKQTKVTKPKTPAHRLKETTSTGHADSPASIVVGKAYTRATQIAGAAPKVICNVGLFKKDMKMDEDLTGVSDIFKTPANSRRKSAFTKANECPVTPHGVGEMSVVNTPEESGEMVVSPISVASTAKLGRYNSEAVTRLLQDDQDASLIEAMDTSAALSQSEVSTVLDEDQTKNKNSGPVQTPQHKPTPPDCLTGVKRLLRTPKEKAEPVEDLRGKLLKTPKVPKLPQEESLEGVKELLNTPKEKETPLEKGMAGIKRSTARAAGSPVACSVSLKRLDKIPKDMAEQEDLTGVKRLLKTPKLKNQPVEEDLTGVKQMMKTPRQKKQPTEEDLTGVKQMMETPKLNNQPVEEDLTGVKQMMKTPRQKKQSVEEDLTGVKQLMETPKLNNQPVEEDLTGVKQMKTPRQKKQPDEEDLTGVKLMMKTPRQKKQSAEEDLTGVKQLMRTPRQKKQSIEEDLTGVKQLMETPKLNIQPVEEDLTGVKQMKTPRQKNQPDEEDLTGVKQLMKTPKQEDLTGVKQTKTPRQKNQPVEEDLTGLKQLMQTPKQKKQPAEEDLTGVKQLMRTPRQKKQSIEEDLTGVKQLMETPKLNNQPVEEDLTGVKQMKTPRQKNRPVGVKSLLQTPKEKAQPVENDFGIDVLMKTPMQKRDEAVLGSTVVAEIGSISSNVLSVADASDESEENTTCPVEDMTNDAKATVGLQMETEEAETSCPEVQEAALETTHAAVEAAPSIVSPKQKEQSQRSSPAKKSRRGVPTAQKSQKNQRLGNSDSLSAGTEKESSAESAKSASVRGRRGKSAIELIRDVSVESPARKSTRGRIPKEQVEVPKSSAEDEQVALKPRRGRKAEQEVEVLQVSPVNDLKASVEVELSVKSPAPTRAKRGRKEKPESENPQEPEVLTEASVEEVGVASDRADLQPSAESEVAPLKSNTRGRRGRTTRKEPTQAAEVEETPDAEVENDNSLRKNRRGRPTKKESHKPTLTAVGSEVKSSDAVVELAVEAEPKLPENAEVYSAAETEDLVKANSKPRRGRATKKETAVTAQVEEASKSASDSEVLPVVKSRRGRRVADESAVEPPVVESQPKPEAPPVRSSRGARNKQMKLQVEDAADGPATETVAPATITEEPVVKTIRGVGRTKQPKVQIVDESPEDKTSIESETIHQTEVPAVRSARGKRTAAVKEEQEAPVKRGRRGATVEVPPPVVKPSRGRKALGKSKSEEVSEDAIAVVEPVEETIDDGAKLQGSMMEEVPLTQADHKNVAVSSEVGAKRGRGKAKVSFKDTLVTVVSEEGILLDTCNKKDEEPATRKDNPSDAETKLSEHSLVKGRKGRGAKKPEEPEKEKTAPEVNIQPARKGRAATSAVPQDEVATCPKRGQKRKEMEVVSEETPDMESLPKRKRGKGESAEVGAATTGKGRRTGAKETKDTSAEELPKKDEKPVRGRKKTVKEDVAPQVEDPVSEVTARRGTRGQKKAETDVPSAPVRRTRRT